MISAVVLAAGEASRMGCLKQLLPWGDKTVLGTVISNLTESTLDGELRVVLGYQADRIRRELADELTEEVRLLKNRDYQRGMFSSVLAGLENLPAETSGLLFMLADQPLVTTDIYNRLLKKFRQEQPLLLVPSYHKQRGHPLLIQSSLIPEIFALNRGQSEPEGGLRTLLEKYSQEIEYLEIGRKAVLIDLDCQEDYQKYAPRKTDNDKET